MRTPQATHGCRAEVFFLRSLEQVHGSQYGVVSSNRLLTEWGPKENTSLLGSAAWLRWGEGVVTQALRLCLCVTPSAVSACTNPVVCPFEIFPNHVTGLGTSRPPVNP